MMAKPCVCEYSARVACAVLWGRPSSLLPRVWVFVAVDLNSLGWLTVGRDSRVDGWLQQGLGLVPE